MTLYELFTPNPGGQAQFLELAGWNSKNPLEQRWSGAIGGINSGKSFVLLRVLILFLGLRRVDINIFMTYQHFLWPIIKLVTE
ncbi:MAG: hypothetical protein ACKN9K_31230, partial [Dolichospermum sp.]